MKHLPAGNTKYLLLDNEEIQRNVSRGEPGGPIVVVVEITEDGPVVHHGYHLLTNSEAQLTYSRVTPLAKVRSVTHQDITIRAAYSTVGAVAIAETPDEVLALPTKPPKSTKGN